ncbi:MAG: protein kinase family protein [Nitrospira sp.]|nr:protein kinase family protein [Nitrospira sp.]
MRANLPDKSFFVGKPIPSRPGIIIREWKASGNNAHLFQGYESALKREFACKIIPRSNLHYGEGGSELWLEEVQKADTLRSPAVVKFVDIREWKEQAADIDCVVLISEFVQGVSLQKFISQHPDVITVAFVVDLLSTLLNLLNEMKVKNVSHGDLHAGNILVEERPSFDLLGPKYVFRVTDFGVAGAQTDYHYKDDYQQLADVLQLLLGKVNYSEQGQKDKFIFNVLREHFIARHLTETDLTRDPLAKAPADLLERLRGLDAEFSRKAIQEADRLQTPFDFLSCEQIGEAPALLHALYSDRFLGLSEIESQNNVVVTGPRGCGKTTVFKSQSLDQKMYVKEAAPAQTAYIGIYYRCDDLYFAFPRYRAPAREEALDIPVHFVTATLLGKLLESIEAWARENFSDEFVRAEVTTAENLWAVLGLTPPPTPAYRTFRTIVATLNKERLRAADRYRFANDQKRAIGRFLGPDALLKACEALSSNLTFISRRPIYFFIDDYSMPKITKDLQANLNRVFMQRTSLCFFKLSTESPVSFVKSDIDQKLYVESREFVLHNLGLVYLRAEVGAKLTFIEDVFKRRLARSQTSLSVSNLEELVGTNPDDNSNEQARQIRDGKKPPLWGKETLCRLCSGDIHYLISLVGSMVVLRGGPQEIAKTAESPKVPVSFQNRAIREEAGRFLKNLRGVPRCGEQLVSIVEAFGNVANSHLKYLESKNEEGRPPKQASRIEPYEQFPLSPMAQELYDELLRYSVFIEDMRGKSRRGNVVPRLYLRRFLIPHFNLTFSTRDSIELEPVDFEQFLTSPKEFEKKFRPKSIDEANRLERQVNNGENQLPLGLEPATE